MVVIGIEQAGCRRTLHATINNQDRNSDRPRLSESATEEQVGQRRGSSLQENRTASVFAGRDGRGDASQEPTRPG